MKRTQEEIKMICEEIRLSVAMKILDEEETNLIPALEREYCFGPLIHMKEYFREQKRMLKAQIDILNLQKTFDTDKKRVEERL